MYIDSNSIIINSISVGKYLVEAKFMYAKLFGDDTGRSLSGEFQGTLIGIFPKLTLQFAPLTQTDIELLAPVFDSATQSVTYYDPNKKQSVSMTTYSTDWELIYKGLVNDGMKSEGFTISFISTTKRS